MVLALVLVIIVVAAGYGVGHRRVATATTTTTTTTTSTSTTTTTVPSKPTTTTPVSLTTCRGTQFSGTNVGSAGAAGTGYDIMTLTKTSPGSCVVDGFPIVSLLGAKGAVITGFNVTGATDFPAGPARGAPSPHTITTGQKVDVQIRYSDIPVGTATCPSVSQVDVQFVAGDQTVPVSFPYPIQPCVG
ncbi:MAG: DUF4232 domain-containing protein, partial [Acidobacteria bacterium]|nr:DUF4232 domain-containing protein [Acidobacteriota bacterium]